MSLSEDLGRLEGLHERGALSDEEFARAKARVLGGVPEVSAPALLAINALRRSRDDRWLGGVCGGIAQAVSYTHLDVYKRQVARSGSSSQTS